MENVLRSIEEQNRCVICGRKKENGQPFKPDQTCIHCDLGVPRMYREFKKKKELQVKKDLTTGDELCNCCNLDWLCCFCPTHNDECNSQWREVVRAPAGYFFTSAIDEGI